MPDNLRLAVFLISILLFVVIFVILIKGRMPLKFALVWLIPAFLILLVSVLPNWLMNMTEFLGFQTLSNMIIGMLFVFVIFVCISLTIIISGQKIKITLLIQELSILKNKIEDLEKKERGE